ncbi:MAG: sigma-54 dependent transcriptional regulator [Desulfobulbaceae bacterium]|nr:sigma-54 dependent transcriptional regulator [Desulfobulbaceae bacterium]
MSDILIIDDDKALCRSLQIQLQAEAHNVHLVHSIGDAIQFIARSNAPDLILLDVNLPDGSGLQRLPDLLKENPNLCIVIMTGDSDNKAVIDAMRNGAFDYLRKPLDLDDLFDMVHKVTDRRKKEKNPQKNDDSGPSFDDMIGSDPQIIDLLKNIGLLSRSRVTVLIRGESGTGKELTARILHEASSPDMPFVAINCSAVVPTLLESELFGYEKGAFTGAEKTKIGKMEYAGEGTLFLDEIGDMPLDLQSKLLRVLQEEEFVRVGGLDSLPLKARVVAATHCDLEEMVEEKKFRQDLFYRLNVSRLQIPPLRKRRQDISLLAENLLRKICRKLGTEEAVITQEAMAKMHSYDWPGNVRELENVLTRAVALSRDSHILAEDIQLHKSPSPNHSSSKQEQATTLADAEKEHIAKTLAQNNWNITHTAQKLAISPTTLRKKINTYQIKKV